jgi:hypothetical protein
MKPSLKKKKTTNNCQPDVWLKFRENKPSSGEMSSDMKSPSKSINFNSPMKKAKSKPFWSPDS